jgi:hypothetical protein
VVSITCALAGTLKANSAALPSRWLRENRPIHPKLLLVSWATGMVSLQILI